MYSRLSLDKPPEVYNFYFITMANKLKKLREPGAETTRGGSISACTTRSGKRSPTRGGGA